MANPAMIDDNNSNNCTATTITATNSITTTTTNTTTTTHNTHNDDRLFAPSFGRPEHPSKSRAQQPRRKKGEEKTSSRDSTHAWQRRWPKQSQQQRPAS